MVCIQFFSVENKATGLILAYAEKAMLGIKIVYRFEKTFVAFLNEANIFGLGGKR